MMRRTGFWGLVPLLLGPMCALAIEVGEIRVNSALNQLFDATIPLPNLTPEELDRFSVKVASPAMFSEFGLDRARVVDQLVFSLQYDAEGQVYVKMVSMQPIREPSLALLLEFGWPRGKTFREYTVLLDPVQRLARRGKERSKTVLDAGNEPGAVPETPKGVITVNTAIGKPSSEPLTVAGAPAAPVPAYRPGDQYGPVLPGEGLWGIALKLRPDPGITREQMMQALFKANPQAFSKAGISGLKGGSMLRIPTLREIAEFSGSAVAAQLAGMNAPAEATAAAASTAPAETTAATKPAAPAEATAATKPAAPAEPPAPTAPLLSETMPAAQSTGKGPDVFVLAPPTPLEPAPVAEAVKAPPVAEPPVAEAVKAPASESPADAAPVMAEMESAGLMEHISVTPLLFLAVSEVMMTAVQLPTPLASGPGHRFAESPPVLASAEPAPVAVSAAPVEPTPVAVPAAPAEPAPVAVPA
ncbi:MAG TPA: FimV/HubP family polar landmark protein, partial [Candidatus Competibacteraceae bacterium]|nr:FimV/HubP family polar landmark protein [Candidatus Competibacteraceae bacterium]